jgi:DNA-binding XRE family transcriptional regulator
MENTTINNRLAQVIKELSLNNNSFASAIGIHGSTIGNITGGRLGKPSFEILEKIAAAFPLVDMNWMVSGEGSPFKIVADAGILDTDCWELLKRAQQREQQLQADYEALLIKFQALKQG